MGRRCNKPELDRDLQALQQNTVEGQGEPTAGNRCGKCAGGSNHCSMWDAIYDCLFFCINREIYDNLTPEQQAVVDECGQKAVQYERYINRSEMKRSAWALAVKEWRDDHK